ncbi:multiple epidermal growth factor-like domains protein 6, partial [Saccostrea cucullata]|uniref:multiple epidermal growth factor-like domains protein 6 n=1 Tax=Saccostrea cuccullata TaxID=36930 RepID=UPI002ED1D3F0
MAAQSWTWFILFPAVIHCYNNICVPNKCTATQSSTRGALRADKVIDGDNLQFFNRCSHTAENETGPAWVMVDLGKKYRLKNVTIFYRNDGTDEKDWKPYRFRKYSLEVFNASDTQDWTQCHKDNTPDETVPPSIQNISCEMTARFIRIITTYDAPENHEHGIAGAILEICEIKIYGCEIGYYGPDCTSCKNCENCDIVADCECPKGFYGRNCSQSCGHCANDVTCDKVTGACLSGYCEPGWRNDKRCDL